ncbi:MAG: hypothetical protein ACI82H_000081 [Alphaproteobacteria bacterium]|jgi:hypothetical protein
MKTTIRMTAHSLVTKTIASLAVAIALLMTSIIAARAADPNPVVVELFTSQGCSSCPPADALLGELAKQPGILALSMHVDYWNGLGWRDPFSSATVTSRQRSYARSLGARYVYTPQMVVGGWSHVVGSDRAAVQRLIAKARTANENAPRLTLSHVKGGKMNVAIGKSIFVGRATLWLAAFDDGHTTKIAAGENGGRSITYSHVVRKLRSIGTWDGGEQKFNVDVSDEILKGYGNCAVLLQADGSGPIIAAASMPIVSAGH